MRSNTPCLMLNSYPSAIFVTSTITLKLMVPVCFGLSGQCNSCCAGGGCSDCFPVDSGLRGPSGDLIDVAQSFGEKSEIALLFIVCIRSELSVLLIRMRLAAGRGVVGIWPLRNPTSA